MTNQLSFLKLLCQELNSTSFLLFNEPLLLTDDQVKKQAELNQQSTANNVASMRSGNRYSNEQGIACAQMTTSGQLLLRITPLAAMFIHGRSDKQLQDICNSSGASIQCWNASYGGSVVNNYNGILKVFLIEGAIENIHKAVIIIITALNKYRELIYGAFKDEIVGVQQVIGGIEFEYVPPPLDAFPYAAPTIHTNFHTHQQSPRTHVVLSNECSLSSSSYFSLATLLPPPHVADIATGTMLPAMEDTGPMRVVNAGCTTPPPKNCQVQNLKAQNSPENSPNSP